jgi:hypothetical protein
LLDKNPGPVEKVSGKEYSMRYTLLLLLVLIGSGLSAMMADTTSTAASETPEDTLQAAPAQTDPAPAPAVPAGTPAGTPVGAPEKKAANPVVVFFAAMLSVVVLGVGAWLIMNRRR